MLLWFKDLMNVTEKLQFIDPMNCNLLSLYPNFVMSKSILEISDDFCYPRSSFSLSGWMEDSRHLAMPVEDASATNL